MLVDLDSRTIFISAIAIDLRKGFQKLADYARATFGIDIYQDHSCCVAFINKTGKCLKVVGKKGEQEIMFTIRLHAGRFQQLSTMEQTSPFHRVSKETFLHYVQGRSIMTKRTHL